VGNKNYTVVQKEQKLNQKIKEMEEFIANFQTEYDKKKAELIELNNEYQKLKEEYQSILAKNKEEAKEIILREIEDKFSEAKKKLEDAELKKIQADDLLNEAKSNYNKTLNDIKQAQIKIEHDKKTSKQEADEYSLATRQSADTYATNTKSAVDDYSTKLKAEYLEKEKSLKEIEKELLNIEKLLHKKEHDQATLQINLDKRQQDAELGFQTILREERIKFDNELSKIKVEIADQHKLLIQGKKEIDDQLKHYKEIELSKINNDLQKEKDYVEQEKEKIKTEKLNSAKISVELEIEYQLLKTSKETYNKLLEDLDNQAEQKLKELYQEVIDARESFKKRCNELQKDVKDKQDKIIELTAKLKDLSGLELTSLKEENKKIKAEIQTLYESEKTFIGKLKQYNVDSSTLLTQLHKIEEYDKLASDYQLLLKRNADIENETYLLRGNEQKLEEEKNKANYYQNSSKEAFDEITRLKNPTRNERMVRFTPYKEFYSISKLSTFPSNFSEISWLKNINEKMNNAEIKIPMKLLYAFHTSIKIHDWSPLVVLAGVSGTGKSELPRQYAHHGGMNFVAVPVKPDWDSMQSLFGYYNSIENKFEPTSLSRAIFHMQSKEMTNTMLLILLDEMNLAYVELYFSDLLSKFENIRGTDEKITYEISLGANEDPEMMEIGKNILWVGTMNEDETTKALSDKVIDRSTLLTFPRPKNLKSRRADIKIPEPEKRLTYELWQKWYQNVLDEEMVKSKIDIQQYRFIIETINDKMSFLNRNLGHRVWQSIERYVFSHPMTVESYHSGFEFKKQFDSAFAEAVAFKIMPKLRGIEISGPSKKILDEIGNIINQEPSLSVLSNDYGHAMSLSSRIFQWSSAKFMDVEDGES